MALVYIIKKIRAALLRLECFFVKGLFSILRLRPTSQPFISGDGFRSLARFKWDENKKLSFDPGAVQDYDIIFISSWNLEIFLNEVQAKINKPFILISANGDINISQAFLQRLTPLCCHWFAQNVQVRDERLTAIPIGLENRNKHWHGIVGDIKRLQKHLGEKVPKILYGFALVNNPAERGLALEVLEELSIAERVTDVNIRDYKRKLSKQMFVASPPGNGEDCHRTWEAMYLKVVPIVKKSEGMEYFLSLGLPLVVIDSWDDLRSWTEPHLVELYCQLRPKFESAILSWDYWRNKILSYQKDLKN